MLNSVLIIGQVTPNNASGNPNETKKCIKLIKDNISVIDSFLIDIKFETNEFKSFLGELDFLLS